MSYPRLVSTILNIGVKLEHPLDQRQSIRFVNGTAFLFILITIVASSILLPIIQIGLIKIRLLIITGLLLLILYWNHKQAFRLGQITLGYIFPLLAFLGQLLVKQSTPAAHLKSFMYYVPSMFIAMLITIPLNIYPGKNKSTLFNVLFIFGLLLLQEPVNYLTGVGFSNTGNDIEVYIIFLGLLLVMAGVFVWMLLMQTKEARHQNIRYRALNINLNKVVKERTQELEKSNEFLKQLHLISIALLSPRERIQNILSECKRFLNMDLAILSHIEDQQIYVVEQVTDNSLNISVNDRYPLANTVCRIITTDDRQYQTPFVITSQQNNEYYKHPAFSQPPMEAYIGIPILVEDQLYGTLNLLVTRTNRTYFTPSEIALFRQAAQAITNELTQQNTQQKLKQHEHEYYTLTQAMPAGVFKHDLVGQCTFVNQKMSEITQLSIEECLGSGWLGCLHNEDMPMVQEAWTNFMQHNQPYDLHFRLKSPLGEVKWVYAQAVKQQDASGNETGIVGSMNDITEIVRSRQESERLILLAKNVDDMVIITDPKGYIEWVNESFTRHTHYTLAEVIDKKPGELLQGEKTQQAKVTLLREAIRQKKPIQLEIINYTKYQKMFWLDIRIQPVFNEQGVLTNYIAIEKDITERKNFIQKLSHSEERFRNYLTNAPFGVFLLDNQGQILEVNQAACKITGYSPQELLTLNFAHIHEKQYQKNLIERLKLIPQTRFHNLDYTFVKKDGSPAYWRINVSLIDEQNLLVFTENITNRLSIIMKLRSNEKKFRSYVNNAPHGVFVTDGQGNYKEVNRAATVITGYSRSELLTMNVLDVYEPHIQEEASEAFALSHEAEVHIELPFIKKDGTRAYWSVSAAKISNDRIIRFVQDITRRKTQEQQLTEMSQEIEIQNHKLQLAMTSGNFIAWELDLLRRGMKFLSPDKENTFFGRDYAVSALDDFLQTVHPTQRETFARKITEHTSGSTPFFQHDFQIETQDQQWKWIHCHGKIIQWNAKGSPVTAYGIMQDISLKKNTELLLFQGQEKERKRISREIHDSIGQMLFASRFLINKYLAQPSGNTQLQQIDDLLVDILKETRYIINNLGVSVFDNDNLFLAFQSLIKKMQDAANCAISFTWNGDHQIIDPSKSTHIFRIFQESLYNAIKYAQASEISVVVDNQDYFQMGISDDGVGFEASDIAHKESFGLNNIKHRAKTIGGQVQIISQPAMGTLITLWLD
ncbi:hypothetical protein BKI52_14030 [marine bacterium AO1-C]|nr:hypothetical protein BKI52_14030 [marine bacterium AO1-C]